MSNTERLLGSYPVKHCEQCGEQLLPTIFKGGSRERSNHFRKRRYCSRVCYHTARKERPATSNTAVQTRIEAYREGKCMFCRKRIGTKNKRRLCVHHIDGDRANNKPENLATLCSSCHSKLHDVLGSYKRGYKKTPKELFK